MDWDVDAFVADIMSHGTASEAAAMSEGIKGKLHQAWDSGWDYRDRNGSSAESDMARSAVVDLLAADDGQVELAAENLRLREKLSNFRVDIESWRMTVQAERASRDAYKAAAEKYAAEVDEAREQFAFARKQLLVIQESLREKESLDSGERLALLNLVNALLLP